MNKEPIISPVALLISVSAPSGCSLTYLTALASVLVVLFVEERPNVVSVLTQLSTPRSSKNAKYFVEGFNPLALKNTLRERINVPEVKFLKSYLRVMPIAVASLAPTLSPRASLTVSRVGANASIENAPLVILLNSFKICVFCFS